MPIPEDELADAMAATRRYGFQARSFKFEWNEAKESARRVANVTVTNTVSGQQKTYDASDATAWQIEFERDLAAGKFSLG